MSEKMKISNYATLIKMSYPEIRNIYKRKIKKLAEVRKLKENLVMNILCLEHLIDKELEETNEK